MNRQEINEKMKQSVEQGFIYVSDIDKAIIKVEIKDWNKKHRCIYLETNCGLDIPIYASNYGRKYWGWALTQEELEK